MSPGQGRACIRTALDERYPARTRRGTYFCGLAAPWLPDRTHRRAGAPIVGHLLWFAHIYTFDEPTSIAEALGLIRGTTDALSFANPSLYKYLLAVLFTGIVGPQRLAETDPSLLFLIARATSAVMGAATVAVIYYLARRLRGDHAGLIAAVLAAVAYPLARESHFGVNDALATLCATAALAACVGVAYRGTRSDYLAAGGLLGLAFAAKYQAAAVLVPFALTCSTRPASSRRRPAPRARSRAADRSGRVSTGGY